MTAVTVLVQLVSLDAIALVHAIMYLIAELLAGAGMAAVTCQLKREREKEVKGCAIKANLSECPVWLSVPFNFQVEFIMPCAVCVPQLGLLLPPSFRPLPTGCDQRVRNKF